MESNAPLVLFYGLLFLVGAAGALPLSRKIPFWLVAVPGFLWGLLLWMTASLIAVLLGLPYSWIVMAAVLAPAILGAVVLNLRLGTYRISLKQGIILLATGLVLSGLAVILTRDSYVYVTKDSFNYILHGKLLARSGLMPWTLDSFTKLGAFSSVVQMSSELLPGEYLSGYQTILAGILLAALSIGMWGALRQQFSPFPALILTGGLVLGIASQTILKHSFYIHNNLPAAVLLFLSIYSFWNLIRGEPGEWIIPGIVCLTGFSFTRIEGPLYACLLLALVVSYHPQPYQKTLLLVLPFSAITLSWHIFLLVNAINNQQLSQTNLLLIIAALAAITLLALASRWIKPYLELVPGLLICFMAACLVLLILIEPEHMLTSITHVWQNLTDLYFWGWTWPLIVAFSPLFFLQTQARPENALLKFFIAGYILTILLLAIARIPYRLGPTDSANRLMLQILPVVLFAISSQAAALKAWFSPPAAQA